MPSIISVIGHKGGTGKTTVSLCLAVAAARLGLDVLLIETDKQGSVSHWQTVRAADRLAIPFVYSPVSGLRKIIAAADPETDLIIIDTGGKNDTASTDAAALSDLVLIPCKPSLLDIKTLETVRAAMQEAGRSDSAFVLLTAVPPLAKKAADEVKTLLPKLYGLQTCPDHLSTRAAYVSAVMDGLTPQEIGKAAGGAAAAEIERLWLFVASQLKQKGKTHEHSRQA